MEGLVVARGEAILAGPLDFSLGGGAALAVAGANGAGKSTLLRTLLGLVPAAGGRIVLDGLSAADGEPARHLGEAAHYLAHRNAMKGAETVLANLWFWRRFLGRPGLAPEEALERVGLGHAGALPFAYLSAGQQRRAALARLLVARRPVWLLDEPTAALDTASQGLFRDIAEAHLADGGILIAATHLPLGLAAAELKLERPRPPANASLPADPFDTWQ
ncbi:cytochrome c biogenesis ATP-binding export protein CcmA [Aureimonas endophytica]|uniref:Cytochrome c biogenesis ATP-binding export protein CcmA n=1 Tax=Aureimonas endophytica TaxID=2027858 RepID=A0A916ZH31_9HYPH|nr:heme ABC exporter ATP-binding protein CcmA [Aureimonas endophytica]GGD96459.1 cytochrome c biogenesis ATP-binding export protein CcmA [Aureimonas endophytica]